MEMNDEVDKFEVLEEKLSRILEGYTKLRNEREELTSRLKEQTGELERLRGEIYSLKNEKSEARTRIERLIEKLEGIPLR